MTINVDWYLELRSRAARLGDQSLVDEINVSLARLGYFETAVVDARERAVPVKRKPGRPRKDAA